MRDGGNGSKTGDQSNVLEACPFELNGTKCPYFKCSKKQICLVS